MISPPRNRVGTVADAVSRSDLLPRADSGAVLREHELRVVRCRYPLCPRRDCHPKGASAFGPPIRRIAPGKCHSATGDVHRFGARPSKTNNEPRALLAARGYWSLALFLRGVGASPFASCECRTRNLGTGTGGVLLYAESLRIPCGGVFAGLFVLFFEGSCPVGRCCFLRARPASLVDS